ncbi:hypothetical transcript [Echinococcus multilocularis]|uniref:Hypothetical transcript n=1 Tax=Echinococcus multilocularis TaxID=6211 RepID=A0A068XV10_ECHMU|nr:hypothetical transcript [Echinococcus multilocularis]
MTAPPVLNLTQPLLPSRPSPLPFSSPPPFLPSSYPPSSRILSFHLLSLIPTPPSPSFHLHLRPHPSFHLIVISVTVMSFA